MAVRLITALLILGATPAFAQRKPVPLAAEAGKPFRHANSGITLPQQLADLQRTAANDYIPPQLDLLFTYADAENREELSVYIYRVTSGVPAIWFEQAVRPISNRPAFRRTTEAELPVAFQLPGQSAVNGMRAAWTVSDSRIRSTALAMVPVGEWLVKFRYSSTRHEVASLMRRLDAMIAEIGWPAGIGAVAATQRIEDCSTSLKLDGPSKPARPDGDGGLGDALSSTLESTFGQKSAQWCRDRTVESALPVYRPVNSDDAYLAALSDSGRAVWVRPSLAGLKSNDRKPGWAVSIVLAGEEIQYQSRDRLPPPAQLKEILDGEPISSMVTWGERKLTIFTSQAK